MANSLTESDSLPLNDFFKDPACPKILLVRLSALGDVIQTLPVLSLIRAHYPNSTIGWLVETDASPLLLNHPQLDHLHISQRKTWVKSLGKPHQWGRTLSDIRQFYQDIQAVQYDVALDIQGLLKSALTLWKTGIPHRIGLKAAREGARYFYNHQIDISSEAFFSPEIPIIQHFKALATAIGCDDRPIQYPLAPIPDDNQHRIKAILAGFNPSSPTIALAPATQWNSKHWPESHWSALIHELLSQTDFNLVLVGGKSDQPIIERILKGLHSIPENRLLNLAGKTTLSDLLALFETVDVVVASDSGPLHMAGGVGKAKLIGIYGPTAYRRTHPPQLQPTILLSKEKDQELPCQPCDESRCRLKTNACMGSITPAMVMDSINALINP